MRRLEIRVLVQLIVIVFISERIHAQAGISGVYCDEEQIEFLDIRPDSLFVQYSLAEINLLMDDNPETWWMPHGYWRLDEDTLRLSYLSDSTLAPVKYLVRRKKKLPELQYVHHPEDLKKLREQYPGAIIGIVTLKKVLMYTADSLDFRKSARGKKLTSKEVRPGVFRFKQKGARSGPVYYLSDHYLDRMVQEFNLPTGRFSTRPRK